jgi:hypothetical protein
METMKLSHVIMYSIGRKMKGSRIWYTIQYYENFITMLFDQYRYKKPLLYNKNLN